MTENCSLSDPATNSLFGGEIMIKDEAYLLTRKVDGKIQFIPLTARTIDRLLKLHESEWRDYTESAAKIYGGWE